MDTEKKTALVVDDSALTRKFIIDFLKPLDLEILQTANGKDAMSFLLAKKIDVLLLDLLMPDVTGWEVLEFMNKKGISVPTIIISADVQDSTKRKCFELGAFAMTHKPPKEAELQEAVQKALGLGDKE